MPANPFSGLWEARFGGGAIGLGGPLTPLVRLLLIVNVAVYVVGLIVGRFIPFEQWFGLVSASVLQGALWQPFTYMFLHGGLLHLLFNLLGLWVFGGEVEQSLGRNRFALLYAICGVGAGLCAVLVGWGTRIPVVGASGAIFGVLIAYAMLFPRRPITLLVFFVIPITLEARWLVAIFAAVDMLTLMAGGGLGQVAHLGGLLFGFLYMKMPQWRQSWQEQVEAKARVVKFRTKQQLSLDRDSAQAEVNALLDKALREGESSLTPTEQERLVQASARLKQLEQSQRSV